MESSFQRMGRAILRALGLVVSAFSFLSGSLLALLLLFGFQAHGIPGSFAAVLFGVGLAALGLIAFRGAWRWRP